MNLFPRWLFLGLFLLISVHGHSEVRMPAIFGNHMVLQQDRVLPVWGWAAPGEKVTVTIANHRAQAVAGADGRWRMELPALEMSATSQTLRIEGAENTLEFHDVLVGDVWLCSGQSNMAIPLRYSENGTAEVPKADDPQLRFFVVPKLCTADPQKNTTGRWEVCTPQTAGDFSAVGHYFAREIRKEIKRPLGMIGAYWGGTPAQTWMSIAALERPPAFTGYVNKYRQAVEIHKTVTPEMTSDYEARAKQWDEDARTRRNQHQAALAAGQKVEEPKPASPPPVQPDPTGVPNQANARPQTPSVVFNAMIAPLIPYAMKGVIWYQGEANAISSVEYRTLFPRLIEDWRGQWGGDRFPFLFVQLPNFTVPATSPQDWPMLREAQSRTLSLPNTGMAVTIDIGNPKDIHPKGKRDVGVRLALAARKVAYGQDIVFSGPIYDSMEVEGNKIRIRFKQIGSGLEMGVPPWTWDGSTPAKPEKLTGFSISGADRKWVDAQAEIDGDEVVVFSDAVPNPIAVRYGWESNPRCNLYNKEGLPASPFRTDDGDDAK